MSSTVGVILRLRRLCGLPNMTINRRTRPKNARYAVEVADGLVRRDRYSASPAGARVNALHNAAIRQIRLKESFNGC